MIIDVHAHVVPGVDDGAVDMATSLEMLRRMHAQGVEAVVCTSHSSIDMEKYHANFAQLQTAAAQAGVPVRVYPGCEVACGMLWMDIILRQIREGYLPMMNGTDCILAEFAPYMRTEEMLHCVRRLREEGGRKVLIAHAERYRALQEDPAAAQQLLDAGAMLQVNAYSLVEEEDERIRTLARRLIDEGKVSMLGSDAHDTYRRPPQMMEGVAYIRKHCDADYAEAVIWRNAQALLGCAAE